MADPHAVLLVPTEAGAILRSPLRRKGAIPHPSSVVDMFRILSYGPSYQQQYEGDWAKVNYSQITVEVEDTSGVVFAEPHRLIIGRRFGEFFLSAGSHCRGVLRDPDMEKRLARVLLEHNRVEIVARLDAAPLAPDCRPAEKRADRWLYENITLVVFHAS